jgi:hypothetical protein
MLQKTYGNAPDGFSKKLENLEAAAPLHSIHYNFRRIHQLCASSQQ